MLRTNKNPLTILFSHPSSIEPLLGRLGWKNKENQNWNHLELFARELKKNWTSAGLEVLHFQEMEKYWAKAGSEQSKEHVKHEAL